MRVLSSNITLMNPDPIKDLDEDGKKDIKPVALAKRFQDILPFARDSNNNLYYYQDGVYRPNAIQLVGELYDQQLDNWGKNSDWKHTLPIQITMYIMRNCPVIWDRPLINHINLKNGIYDWHREKLLPHSSDNLSLVQLPFQYDPYATCPEWDRFIESVFPEGRQLIYELIGLLTIPYTRLQKTILLLGPGSNGKGTFLRAINKFLGEDNVSHVSLHQLEEEKFSRSMIVGKLVNMFGDLPVYKIDKTNFFKSLTGEDTIQIEHKGQTPFPYVPFCRIIFSGNKLPKVDDDTEGYLRRWLVIPFLRKFQVDPSKGESIENILSSPNELSGVFNKAMQYLPNVVDHGFSITEEIANIVTNYQPIPENIAKWMTETLVEDPDGKVPCAALYRYFQLSIGGNRGAKEGASVKGAFITFLRSSFPGVKANIPARNWDGNVREVRKCYTGVRMIKPELLEDIIDNPLGKKLVSIKSGQNVNENVNDDEWIDKIIG